MQQSFPKITPIGSCRIVGPLRTGAAKFGYKLNRVRSYGYCHSSLEAVQQVRFLQGDYHPSDLAWPMMSRNHQFDAIKATKHQTSDLYVVELSSQKQLTLRGHAVQLNYVQQHFSDFFSDRNRSAEFWELDDKQSWLNTNWPGLNRKAEREILVDLRRSQTDVSDLDRHLQELKARLPQLLVVTHVNAKLPDGKPIRSRERYIDLVQAACARNGLQSYDPTKLMELIGQDISIEAGSDSYAHYTADFEKSLAQDLVSNFSGDGATSTPKLKPLNGPADLVLTALDFERAGHAAEAFETVASLVRTEPSPTRCKWLARLSKTAKIPLNQTQLLTFATHCSFNLAYRHCATPTDQEWLRCEAAEDTDIQSLMHAIPAVNEPETAVSIAKEMRLRALDDGAFVQAIVKHIDLWLPAIQLQKDIQDKIKSLLWLESLAPQNRNVRQAMKQANATLLEVTREAFRATEETELDELAAFNNEQDLRLQEISFLHCRSLMRQDLIKKAYPVAQGLVLGRPDHLSSWVLLMRAADKIGAKAKTIEAAKRVQELGRDVSPRHTNEADTLTARLMTSV